jgi:maltose alpha-D-glucosyltransferase / alpha-amylase
VTEHAEGPETAYLWVASLLGRRVGELHAALAADLDDPAFAPEPITPFARRAVYQSLRNLVVRVRDLARASLGSVPEPAAAELERLIAAHDRLLERMRTCTERGLRGAVMRVHGDLHLGQVLFTGRDFVIIDFEGEPARSLGERRRKRSPMVDVAGMLRSYHYVVETATSGHMEGTRLRPEDRPTLQPHAERWLERVGDAFVTAYLEQAQPIGVLPEDPDALHALLELHLLEKALYEVGYELNNRPAWVGIPLHGLVDRIEADRDG